MFRFLITLGSLIGFVTGGLDLLERFGVPVDNWLRSMPEFAARAYSWFGFQVERISVAVFGATEPGVTTRSYAPNDNEIDGVSGSPLIDPGASAETLVISGIFTFMMLVILLLAARGGER